MPRRKYTPAEKLKIIRPYVSFNYDLRKPLNRAQLKKIHRYYVEFRYLAQRPTSKIFRYRNSDHLKEAQTYGGHPKGYSEFKVAFVPIGEEAKLTFNKYGKAVLTTPKGVKRVFVELDGHKIVKWLTEDEGQIEEIRTDRDLSFAEKQNEYENIGQVLPNAEKYINARIDFDAPKAKAYLISSGANELPRSFIRKSIAKGVIRYLLRYPDNVRHFNGVFALYAGTQKTALEYQNAKREARKNKNKKSIINARTKAIRKR